jgi:hypothetical protein
MTRAAFLSAPQPGDASVVFVRPESSCDGGDYSIVVDDHGRFVGNVAPGTRVSVPVRPGTHIFYAWSSLDLRVEKEPNFNPVAAVRVNAVPSQTEYVSLTDSRHHFECNAWMSVEMTPQDVLSSDLAGWLNSSKAVVADRGAGQAALNARPALLQTDLELGQAKLQRLDELHAREERRRALTAELQ